MSTAARPLQQPDRRHPPAPQGRHSLRLVPPLRTGAPRAPFVLLLGALLAGGLAALLWLHTALAEDSFRLQDLTTRSSALEAREQALELEVARAASPRVLARRAEAMGMVRSVNPAFIRLSDGQVLGKPRPATAAPVPTPTVAAAVPTPSAAATAPGAEVSPTPLPSQSSGHGR